MNKEEMEPEPEAISPARFDTQPTTQAISVEDNLASNTQPTTQTVDVENNPSKDAAAKNYTSNFAAVVGQWKKENLLQKCTILSRASCWLFSFISFVIMASNKQGTGQNFDEYEEYKLRFAARKSNAIATTDGYLLAAAILSFVYAMVQVVYQVYKFTRETYLIPKRAMGIFSYAGDQVTAYLLMSALSAAIPVTDRKRRYSDNLFTDLAASSVGMAFIAFVSIALSSLISGYKLSTETCF